MCILNFVVLLKTIVNKNLSKYLYNVCVCMCMCMCVCVHACTHTHTHSGTKLVWAVLGFWGAFKHQD